MNELNYELFKDLVESTHFKNKKCVRNPLNIIFMLENYPNLPNQTQLYLEKLKLKEKSFTKKSTRKVSSFISNILSKEIVFLKRFDNLVTKIDNINSFAFAIVDLKNIRILKHSIDCGLNINIEKNNNSLLKYVVENKNTIVSNYLYNLKNIDKLKTDSEGNNLAHISAYNKNYKIIDNLSKEYIDLFYMKNNDNITAIDIMFNYKQYATIPNKTKILFKKSILNFLHLHNTGEKILPEVTMEKIKQSETLKDIFIESNYIKMNNLLVNKNINHKKDKVKKI